MTRRCVRPTSAHPRIRKRAPIVSCGDRVSRFRRDVLRRLDLFGRPVRTVFSRHRARFGGSRSREIGRFLPVLRRALRATSDTPVTVPRASRRDFARDKAPGSAEIVSLPHVVKTYGAPRSGMSSPTRRWFPEWRTLSSLPGPAVAMPLRQRYVVAPTRSGNLVVHSGTHAGARSFDRCSSGGALAKAGPLELHHANVSRRSRRGPVWKGERHSRRTF